MAIRAACQEADVGGRSKILKNQMCSREQTLRRFHFALPVAMLCAQAALLSYAALVNSPTQDEPAHLVSGACHWQTGNFEYYKVNPPLIRMLAAAPIVLCGRAGFPDDRYANRERGEFLAADEFTHADGARSLDFIAMARLTLIPIVLLGGWICHRWAFDLYGRSSATAALSLWCFSPAVLGNGALITPDAAAASLGVVASYSFWRWRPRYWAYRVACAMPMRAAHRGSMN